LKRKELRVKIKEAFQQGHEQGLSELSSKIDILKKRVNKMIPTIEALIKENDELKTKLEEKEK